MMSNPGLTKIACRLFMAFSQIISTGYIYFCRIIAIFLLPPAVAFTMPEFEITELDTGKAVEQTVMTAFLEDTGQADLIVISVSGDFEKKLKLYEMGNMGNSSEASLELSLDKNIISTDVGQAKTGDIFVLFTDSEAIRFDPRTGRKKTLIRYRSIYNTPIRDSIPNLNLFRDLNRDGLDDFFIPGFNGVTGYIQQEDGSFSEGIAMYAPPRMFMSAGTASYQSSENYFADMNLDGFQDAIFWVEDELSIYPGRADGLFESTAMKFNSAVPYEYGSIDEMNRFIDEHEKHSDFNSKALFRFADLDNDHITDLIVISIRSEGLLDKTNTYEVHKGIKGDNGQLVFSDEPISRIVSKGITFPLLDKDFNNDKKTDFLVPSVEISLGKIVKALFSGSVNIDLEFYQMSENGYPEKPNTKQKISVKFDLTSGRVSFPTILSADLDLDGYEDLIVQKGSDTLQIFPGIESDELFDNRSIDLKVELPESQDAGGMVGGQGAVGLVKLNNDEKPDILIRHDSKTESNRIILLLSK